MALVHQSELIAAESRSGAEKVPLPRGRGARPSKTSLPVHPWTACIVTVTRLRITGKLKLMLQSTNPCESMVGTVLVIQPEPAAT